MRRDPRGPEWKPRKCPCCKLMFVPPDKNPYNAKRRRFCGKRCKDGFHRNGGMDIERFTLVVTRRVTKELLKDDAFLDTLRDKLRVVPLRKELPWDDMGHPREVRMEPSPAAPSESQRSA